MQVNLLNEIVSDIVGRNGLEILNLLIDKKDVNEFLIAKKLKLTINQVRNLLYRLSNYSLVSFTRKKDKRKGWYTYFWTLDNEKALELLNNKLEKEVEVLKQQLKNRETKRFYFCKTCKTEVSEETALMHNFICQECGEVYELIDNRKAINEIKNSISRIERQRQGVTDELGKIKQEKEKKREKEARKEERKKRKKRAKKIKRKVKKKKKEKKKIKRKRKKKK